jgi:pyruvate formate lyase activating enzyme
MQDSPNTPAKTLLRAAEIGREAGLRYVYAGNLPGRVDEYETTFCPKCNTALVERTGYAIRAMRVTSQGGCPQCGVAVAGVWPEVRDGAVD